jgi:hypothetical protein
VTHAHAEVRCDLGDVEQMRQILGEQSQSARASSNAFGGFLFGAAVGGQPLVPSTRTSQASSIESCWSNGAVRALSHSLPQRGCLVANRVPQHDPPKSRHEDPVKIAGCSAGGRRVRSPLEGSPVVPTPDPRRGYGHLGRPTIRTVSRSRSARLGTRCARARMSTARPGDLAGIPPPRLLGRSRRPQTSLCTPESLRASNRQDQVNMRRTRLSRQQKPRGHGSASTVLFLSEIHIRSARASAR